MLINRIERSMEIMLEGLDRCDPYLMIEASKEFDTSVKETAKIAKDFALALEDAVKSSKSDYNGNIEPLVTGVRKLADSLSKVKTDKVPDKFSFYAAQEMRDADGDNAVGVITMHAAQLDVLFKSVVFYNR